jgi:hypothetical protein
MSANNNQNNAQKLKCNHCKRKGHIESNCWKKHPELRPKKAKNGQNKPSKPETTLITQEEEEGQLVENSEMALSTFDNFHNQNIWVLDSGATRHICAYKTLFSDLRPYILFFTPIQSSFEVYAESTRLS